MYLENSILAYKAESLLKARDQKMDILSRRVEIMNLILEIIGKNKIAMQKELEKLKKMSK